MAVPAARYSTPATEMNTPEGGGSPAASPRKRPRTTTHSRDWDIELATSASSSRKNHADRTSGNVDRMSVKNAGPDASFISPPVASATVRRFVAAHVTKEGFERVENPALHRFELEVVSFVEQLFARAKAYAEVANRSRPNAMDVLEAAEEYDIDMEELAKEGKKYKRKQKQREHRNTDLGLELVLPSKRSVSPELLPSDDEESMPSVPQTLQALPSHLPPLPPKHTYLRTPVPPPKKQALPSLEKKLENAALVQESLRSLLLATEIDADQNDGELFGGVVNWEATRYPRKKWKITVERSHG